MIKKESTRIAFTEGLMDLASKRDDVCLVCSDSIKVVKAEPFAETYPDRYFDMGIAEQNTIACAAGLAASGLTAFVATYAGFITMRACEQVRTFVAYPGLNVKMVGANGGISAGEREGVTHQFFEDIGIMRTIPRITVVVPADASQVKKAVMAVAEVDGPAYIRIGSGRDPVVFDTDMPFELGKARILKSYGNDVALMVNGLLINRVLEAAEKLHADGVNATVVEVHTLKPLDNSFLIEILGKTRAAVTIEDHNIIGGLGSAIAELACEEIPVPVARIGLRDVYPESGDPDPLLDRYKMGIQDITEAARKVIGMKGA